MRQPFLAPTLILIATSAAAVEPVPRAQFNPVPQGTVQDVPAGRPLVVGGRTVTVLGMIDLDAIQRGNYTDGNDDLSDTEGTGFSRAEIGFRLGLREKIQAQINIGYRTEAGGLAVNNPPAPPNGTPENEGVATLQEARVGLFEFAGLQSLSVEAGRMKVHWETVREGPSFLLDSRGDDRDITGWDGIRAA